MNIRSLVLLATAAVTVTAEATYYPSRNGLEPVPPIEAPPVFLRLPRNQIANPTAAMNIRRVVPAFEIQRLLNAVLPHVAPLVSRMPMTPGNATDPWMPMLRADPALEGKLLFAPIEIQPAAK